VGSFLTISLNEGLRVAFGTNFIGAANTIYGILLILFIIFMPRGIVGMIEDAVKGRWRGKTAFYSVIRRPSSADQ
jgi:branched-chain amino acid transport system permease protein